VTAAAAAARPRSALAVIAKAPVPGRVKTRLCPPYTPAEAAALAEAALRDTLAAVARAPAARRVVILDGVPGPWLPRGFAVLPQRGGGLAERLAHAFEDLAGPALVVGMDTPQLTPELLSAGLAALQRADAVLGPALDGGYWAVGLRRPDARAFAGVPMSTADTGRRQRRRLRALGLRVASLPALRDVDHAEDVRAVARQAPGTGFAACALRFAA
jgi:rSAM/selenodomain-associated transferase 1